MVQLPYYLKTSLLVSMECCDEAKGQFDILELFPAMNIVDALGPALRGVKGNFLHFSVSFQFAQKVVHLPRVKVPSRYIHAFKYCPDVLEALTFNR